MISWQTVPGGWYVDALVGGQHCAIVPRSHVDTHLGPVPLPPQEPAGSLGVLYLRCALEWDWQAGRSWFKFAGQSHGRLNVYYEWHERDGWREIQGVYEGTNPCIYDFQSTLRVNDGSAGSQGYRFVQDDGTPAGKLITGDATYYSPLMDLSEWSRIDAMMAVGQGHPDAAKDAAWIWDGRQNRLLHAGPCTFIHAAVEGQNFAIAFVAPGQSVIARGTLDDLRALPLVQASDVPAIGKPCLFGWFTDEPTDAPGNCNLVVDFHGKPASNDVVLYDSHARVMHYVEAEAIGTIEALEQAVDAAHAKNPAMPVLAYWPAKLQGGRAPANAEYVGVEAYMLASETVDAYEARVRLAVTRCKKAVLIPNCYTSSATLTTNLMQVVAPVGRVARDSPIVVGIIPFSAGSRPTGWNDHPEVHGAWQMLFAGVTGVPDVPARTTPPPPSPAPIPQPPQPQPPQPPEETPVPNLTDDQKNEVCDAIGQIALSAFGARNLQEASQGVRQALDQGITDVATLIVLAKAREGGASPQDVERAAAAGRLLQGR